MYNSQLLRDLNPATKKAPTGAFFFIFTEQAYNSFAL